MNEYSPLETFSKVYRLWWVVALFALAGGAAGWIFHRFQSPVYEASATIVAQVDLTQTGDLTELEQDQAMGAVMALFISTPVLEAVAENAQAEGLAFPGIAFNRNFFLERRRSNLMLIVRDRDPQVAAAVANLWAERAYQALEDAHTYALQAQEIRQRLFPYAGCPTPAPAEGTETCPAPLSPVDPQEVPALETELEDALANSNAIHPAMIFDLSRLARVPRQPVALRADLLSLAGALIGFVCGVVVVGFSSSRGKTPSAEFASGRRK